MAESSSKINSKVDQDKENLLQMDVEVVDDTHNNINIEVQKEKTQTTLNLKKTLKRKRSTIQQAHQNSAELLRLSERKINTKEQYYKKKIELLQEHNEIQKRLVTTLENIKDILMELI